MPAAALSLLLAAFGGGRGAAAHLPLGLSPGIRARTRVDLLRLADDEAILHKLANVLAWGAEGRGASADQRRQAHQAQRSGGATTIAGGGALPLGSPASPAGVRRPRAGCLTAFATRRARGRGVREFAIEISLTSFGSSQILPLPHFSTEAARRFCSRRETPMPEDPAYGGWRCGDELWHVSGTSGAEVGVLRAGGGGHEPGEQRLALLRDVVQPP